MPGVIFGLLELFCVWAYRANFAGIFLRNDLRIDLLHVDILRTWPLREFVTRSRPLTVIVEQQQAR